MYKPHVSVIMPVLNGECYLDKSIESMVKQTFHNFELIIINDGSTDHTQTIIKKNQLLEPRMKVISHRTCKGIPFSLNEGIALAQASTIARMDADDMAHPQRLEQEYVYLSHHPDVAIVGSNVGLIDEKGHSMGSWTYPENQVLIRWRSLLKNPFAHSSVMFRKDIILETGGYSHSAYMFEDHELWSRVLEKYAGYNLQHILQYYRIHSHSVSQSHNQSQKQRVQAWQLKRISRFLAISEKEFYRLKSQSIKERSQRKQLLLRLLSGYASALGLPTNDMNQIKLEIETENSLLYLLKKNFLNR